MIEKVHILSTEPEVFELGKLTDRQTYSNTDTRIAILLTHTGGEVEISKVSGTKIKTTIVSNPCQQCLTPGLGLKLGQT